MLVYNNSPTHPHCRHLNLSRTSGKTVLVVALCPEITPSETLAHRHADNERASWGRRYLLSLITHIHTSYLAYSRIADQQIAYSRRELPYHRRRRPPPQGSGGSIILLVLLVGGTHLAESGRYLPQNPGVLANKAIGFGLVGSQPRSFRWRRGHPARRFCVLTRMVAAGHQRGQGGTAGGGHLLMATGSDFTAILAPSPKGLLLVGPPGTGKTLCLAKASCWRGGARWPFFSDWRLREFRRDVRWVWGASRVPRFVYQARQGKKPLHSFFIDGRVRYAVGLRRPPGSAAGTRMSRPGLYTSQQTQPACSRSIGWL